MPIQFPQFNTANVPGAVGAAEDVKGKKIRNALAGYEQDEVERARKTRAEIEAMRKMTDNAGEAISRLEADGNHEAAEALRGTVQAQYQNTIKILESGKGWIDETNYKEVRSQLLNQGVIGPDDMPDEYDGSYFDREIEKVKNKLGKITVTQGTGAGGAESTDMIFDEYGQERFRGEPYDPKSTKSGGADGKPWEMDASDSNTVGRSVGEFLGATYSPITGTFSGLNREQAQQAQTIKEEASRIYREQAGQISHEEAVSQAVRQFGVDVRKLQDERASDPLGLRNALDPGSQ